MTKNTAQFWEKEIELGVVEVNEKKRIIIKETELRGGEYVDIRQQYLDKSNEWKFGKGIAIPAYVMEGVIAVLNNRSQ